MADIADGAQFSDLPSCLAIDILLRLPLKTLLVCRYVRKDWTRLYFSDPYFIRRQLETSNIQFLDKDITSERKFRFGCFVDEVSTGNVRIETLELPCKLLHVPKYYWRVINSCNGLVCLIDAKPPAAPDDSSSVYVCNPILGEWVSIPVPDNIDFHSSRCALGFSAKNNEYKILQCIDIYSEKYEWKIYTLGTGHWRSIETKENIKPWEYWDSHGVEFNTFIHGSLHWLVAFEVQSFDFETERFTMFPLPEVESDYINDMDVTLGVINGRLWASFYNSRKEASGEMWALKEYGDEKSWTMTLALRKSQQSRYDITDGELRARNKELVIYKDHQISEHKLLFALNGEEMLTWHKRCQYTHRFVSYNLKTMRSRLLRGQCTDWHWDFGVAYNPSFDSLHDVGRGEAYDGYEQTREIKEEASKRVEIANKRRRIQKFNCKH